jgi:dTDP-4-amino-4,6-dideoxygalactose transaminase
MDAIMAVARKHNVSVVEDNAHGLFGRYRGRYLGTFGALATQSFHETKNYACGEGGALLINDPSLVQRAEILREKGTNRSRFFRGQVDKYSWVDIGSSYLPSDVLAAFLYAQLENRKAVQEQRRRLWLRYAEALGAWARGHSARLPVIPAHCDSSYHIFYLLMASMEERQAFIAHMRERSIATPFHYLPLHRSVMGRALGGYAGQCPVSERVCDRLVRLPLYYTLSDPEQAEVIERVLAF